MTKPQIPSFNLKRSSKPQRFGLRYRYVRRLDLGASMDLGARSLEFLNRVASPPILRKSEL